MTAHIFRRKILSLIILLVSIGACAQNLVVDPGFENGLNGWLANTNAPSFISIQADGTVSHSGNSSLRIHANHDSISDFGLVTQYFILRPGGHYLFSWFIKTDSVVNGSAFPYTIIYLNGVRLYGEAGYTMNGTTEWQQFDYRFYTPQNSDTVQLLLAMGASNGSTWYDDISLTELTDTTYHPFSVELDSLTGTMVRPFTSTNVGPADPAVSSLNLTPQFEQLGMEYVRTHDFQGPCDMHVIFPDTSRSAFDSTAYNFFWTDSVIRAIVGAGCKVYFRLGESGTVDTGLYDVPGDMNKWADVAVHIMEHFNHGWDHGYNFDIRYWEIFNEPDIGWNGTVEQFITLYRLASTGLKAADSTLMIGGPAISSLMNTGFLYTFLDSVAADSLPFDFFSYHYYHTLNPYDFYRYDNYARQMLLQRGLGHAERIVSEWSNYNYNPGNNYYVWRNDPFIAASGIAALSYYQNTDVFKLLRYRTDGTDLGMYDATGNYTYTGLAYYFMSNFRNVPYRLQCGGEDTLGTSILGGQSLDGSLVAMVLADNCSAAHGYDVSVNGISPSEQYKYSIFRIDSNISSTPVDSGIVTAVNNFISVPVEAPYADFIVMTRSIFTAISKETTSVGIDAYPNPFSDRVSIRFDALKDQMTGIIITDMLGRTVRVFNAGNCRAGHVEWEGRTDDDQIVAAGLYLVHLQTSAAVYTTTLVRID